MYCNDPFQLFYSQLDMIVWAGILFTIIVLGVGAVVGAYASEVER